MNDYNPDEYQGQGTMPTLYTKTADGSIGEWTVWSMGDEVVMEWGKVGGKMQQSSFKCTPKNVGRANSTTAEQQAVLEAISHWKKKLKKKYFLTPEQAEGTLNLKPMLAKDFKARSDKAKKDFKWPADGQPKLDGVRCITYLKDGKLIMQSRGGDPYNIPHIAEKLRQALGTGIILDGELYCHGEPLQTITSWAKRVQPDTQLLSYVLYDIAILEVDQPWLQRKELLKVWHQGLEQHLGGMVELLPCEELNDEDDVKAYHDACVSKGYEGAIIRQRHGVYRFGHRSSELLKYKDFKDDEFKIVGFTQGKGKFLNVPIFRCETKDGKQFDVTPRGSEQVRAQMLRDAPSYIGKDLTVRYFQLTQDGIPQFPVGIAVREKGT